jgi:glycosyltransferase involved in cell wall biosynthesis
MERPIVLGVRGESRVILEKAQAGVAIAPESGAELARAVVELAGNAELCLAMGRSGRAFARREFNRDQLAQAMLSHLAEAAGIAA